MHYLGSSERQKNMPLEDENGSRGKVLSEPAHTGTDRMSTGGRKENSQEVKLFKSINQFIGLVSSETRPSGSGEKSKVNDKFISNFLRLNLLSYLRQLQQYPHRAEPQREVLIQWWVTLLNFLNSDLIADSARAQGPSDPTLSYPHPFLSIETVSVCLECVSRLMSSLMILPTHGCEQTETFSHHILLTIHFVTNRLILNSKHTRQSADSATNRSFLHYLSSYSSLIRSFLGKLNAYAFFYLPDEFHYDTQILLAVTPAVSFHKFAKGSLFPWKKRCYTIQEDLEKQIKPEEVETRETRFFKIIISYMKNDSVLVAFYWHYWYIVLRFVSLTKNFYLAETELWAIPGSVVLMRQVTYSFLAKDFGRFNRFISASSSNKTLTSSNFNEADTMPDSNLASNDNSLTTEMISEFVFTHFSILRLWESLRSLSGCFPDNPNMTLLLALHDSSQLDYIMKIPAYDSNVASVIFNKILQFIVFQFESSPTGSFLHWDVWSDGMLSMIRTLNANCQVIALTCLFNNWPRISSDGQNKIISHLLGELWLPLTVDCEFQLSKVIFFKLLVFRIVPGLDNLTKALLREKLQHMHGELLFTRSKFDDLTWNEETDNLLFYGNRKFSLLPNNCLKEEDLIYRAERETRNKVKRRSHNFPSVIGVANVRPSLILKNGRYPYDVFDEIVAKAASLMAEKKRKESGYPLPAVSESLLKSARGPNSGNTLDNNSSKRASSISSTIGSWLSKLTNDSDSSKRFGSSPRNATESTLTTYKNNKSNLSDAGLPPSSSTDMLSMYSTVSSLATGRTNSSDDQLGNTELQAPHGPTYSSSFKEGMESNAKEQAEPRRKKKKLLSPVELKYTSSILEKRTSTFIFKVIVVPCESAFKKTEKANASWSVVTAKTYDKPLPTPDGAAAGTIIEDMRHQSLDYLGSVNQELEQLALGQGSSESSVLSYLRKDDLFPHPDYSILESRGDSDCEALTTDSEALLRFSQKLKEVKESENPQSLIQGGFKSFERPSGLNKMYLETRAKKLSTLLRMFNQTVEEYHQFTNILGHEELFLEFEVKINSVH